MSYQDENGVEVYEYDELEPEAQETVIRELWYDVENSSGLWDDYIYYVDKWFEPLYEVIGKWDGYSGLEVDYQGIYNTTYFEFYNGQMNCDINGEYAVPSDCRYTADQDRFDPLWENCIEAYEQGVPAADIEWCFEFSSLAEASGRGTFESHWIGYIEEFYNDLFDKLDQGVDPDQVYEETLEAYEGLMLWYTDMFIQQSDGRHEFAQWFIDLVEDGNWGECLYYEDGSLVDEDSVY